MNCSTPGFLVLHCLSEFAHIHIHGVGDAIQPPYPLLPPSLPAPTLLQHEGLFQWVSSSQQVAKVLEYSASVLPMNIQGWFPLGLTGLISLMSKGLSRVFSSTTVQKHQSFNSQLSSGLISFRLTGLISLKPFKRPQNTWPKNHGHLSWMWSSQNYKLSEVSFRLFISLFILLLQLSWRTLLFFT